MPSTGNMQSRVSSGAAHKTSSAAHSIASTIAEVPANMLAGCVNHPLRWERIVDRCSHQRLTADSNSDSFGSAGSIFCSKARRPPMEAGFAEVSQGALDDRLGKRGCRINLADAKVKVILSLATE